MKQEIHNSQQEPICMWHTIEDQTERECTKGGKKMRRLGKEGGGYIENESKLDRLYSRQLIT